MVRWEGEGFQRRDEDEVWALVKDARLVGREVEDWVALSLKRGLL